MNARAKQQTAVHVARMRSFAGVASAEIPMSLYWTARVWPCGFSVAQAAGECVVICNVAGDSREAIIGDARVRLAEAAAAWREAHR